MQGVELVVRARHAGGSWDNLKKLNWPDNSYNFQEGELGILDLRFVGIGSRGMESYVPFVKWDNDPSGNFVTVDGFITEVVVIGVRAGNLRVLFNP